MLMRLRVGGLTLTLAAPRRSPALEPTAVERAFTADRGADIDLEVREGRVPDAKPGTSLFDSGGIWQVQAHGRRYLYTVREEGLDGPVTRGLVIDRGWKRGVLYLAPGPRLAAIGHALSYPLGEILFSHRITASGGLVLHACAVVVDGCAVLFSGFSGAGKTTMARLWRRHCPSVKILSDDRVVLREHRGGLHAWGTPWHGTGGFASPCGARLRAVVFIRHGTRNDFTPLAPPAAAAMLLARSFPPIWSRPAMTTALRTVEQIVRAVPAYDFAFRVGKDAVSAVGAALDLAAAVPQRRR